jgi:ankyrin repeat protein
MMCCETDLFCEFFGLNNVDVPNYVDFLEIPIERAARTKNIDLVRVIANAGKNLPRWSICLAAALVAAVEIGDKDMVLILLSAGADPSTSFSEEIPLVSAVGRNDIEMVKLLLAKGAFVDPITTGSLITPLLYAAMYNRLEIVEILVNAGADVNFISPDSNEGALAKAALHGCYKVYEYLLPLISNQNEIEFARKVHSTKNN